MLVNFLEVVRPCLDMEVRYASAGKDEIQKTA